MVASSTTPTKRLFSDLIRDLTRSRLVGHFLSLGVGGAVSWVFTFLAFVYTARSLGPAAFGLLNFGISIAAYATALIGSGLTVWGVRTVARDNLSAGRYLLLINATQTVLAALTYLLLSLIAFMFFEESNRLMILSSGIMLFGTSLSVQWICQALEKIPLIGLGQTVISGTTLAGLLLFVHSPEHVYRAPFIMLIGQVATAALILAILLLQGALSFSQIEWRWALHMWWQALPLGFSAIMITILHYINNLYLYLYFGSATLGLFSAGFRLVEQLAVVPAIISTVFLPRLSQRYTSNPAAFRHEMSLFVTLMVTAGIFSAVVFFGEPSEIVLTIYGPAFLPATAIMRAMSWVIFFNFVAIAYIMGLLAANADRAYFLSILAALLLAVVGGWLAVPRYGLLGATVIVASLDTATLIVALTFYKKHLPSCFLRAWIRPLIAGILFALWLYIARSYNLPFIARVAVGSALCIPIAIPWRMVTPLLRTSGDQA